MITSIIIDDEPKAADYLQTLITELDKEVKIAKVFNDPQSGLDYLRRDKVDLVFLDIEMPGMSGLDLLSQFDVPSFEVIFVTGYDQYALQAFNFCAIGYILKPVDEEDILLAIKNAKRRISQNQSLLSNQMLIRNLRSDDNAHKRIGVQTKYGLEFVTLSEIIRCEALQKVTKVVTSDREYISSYNIGHFSKLLADFSFFQIHKSHLVNLSRIIKMDKNGMVLMSDNAIVPVARRRKAEFTKLLSDI